MCDPSHQPVSVSRILAVWATPAHVPRSPTCLAPTRFPALSRLSIFTAFSTSVAKIKTSPTLQVLLVASSLTLTVASSSTWLISELALKVRHVNPKTLDEAIRMTLEWEAVEKDIKDTNTSSEHKILATMTEETGACASFNPSKTDELIGLMTEMMNVTH
ncbi:unnamed protein product [Mytilus coruscus]|uniref:Uncharacterized protein n=1 Tax=Mytilus coruscus TaxID=42192 RepID=A0A6J8EMT6_MYTCO|nr:unnamed protein product [Mytilus coruscus]